MCVGDTKALNPTEIYVLRLTLHGYSSFEIIDFLEMSLDSYFESISRIKFKLGRQTMYKVLAKSLELKIINPLDYIDDVVKQHALSYSEKVVSAISNQKVHTKDVKKQIVDFYKHCKVDFKNKNKFKFSYEEKRYLNLKFLGVSNDYLSHKMDLSVEKIENIKNQLFEKLKDDCWYTIFKKAFQVGVLDDEDYLNLDLEQESHKVAINLISSFSLQSLMVKEKQFLVYQELLLFYTAIECNCLAKSLL